MDLISWYLNAIDTIFSTRSSGSGEPVCPAGTFVAGYTMDAWEQWRVVCLATVTVALNRQIDNIMEKIMALQMKLDRIGDLLKKWEKTSEE